MSCIGPWLAGIKCNPIGSYDVLIAGEAMALNLEGPPGQG
jgi:hypothetical protein